MYSYICHFESQLGSLFEFLRFCIEIVQNAISNKRKIPAQLRVCILQRIKSSGCPRFQVDWHFYFWSFHKGSHARDQTTLSAHYYQLSICSNVSAVFVLLSTCVLLKHSQCWTRHSFILPFFFLNVDSWCDILMGKQGTYYYCVIFSQNLIYYVSGNSLSARLMKLNWKERRPYTMFNSDWPETSRHGTIKCHTFFFNPADPRGIT